MESGGATSALDTPTEMTAADDDGEGWVTCTRDIQNIKATGSLHLPQSGNATNSNNKSHPPKNPAPPITQRAACATTDFAMQNVILQMNLELLTVDGVRVRRLKTWVTRCAACFTIYGGSDDKKGKSGGRLFCDKCGSNALQRIAASVDRNTGRLKLHMRKHYQFNTRGTKFSLPKAGKVS
jgi:RNA-binding protein NOB1